MEILALFIILFIVIVLEGYYLTDNIFRNLEYDCFFSCKEAHEGDNLYLVETIHNKKLLPVPWLKVEIRSSKWLDFANTRSLVAQEKRYVTSTFLLKSFQKTTRKWKLKCLKRGIYEADNVTLVGGDLLGLSVNSKPVPIKDRLLVFPALINLDERVVSAHSLQGDRIVQRWILDDPFIVQGAREYMPGDPLNRIHWPATARQGRLMVRKNDFTSKVSLTIVLNIQSLENERGTAVYPERVEDGIRVAATLLDRAAGEGMPARLVCNGGTHDKPEVINTASEVGKEHIRGLLELLAGLELKSLRDFELYLDDVSDSIHESEVVVITSYANDLLYENMRKWKRQDNYVTAILLNLDYSQSIPDDLDIRFFMREGVTPEIQ